MQPQRARAAVHGNRITRVVCAHRAARQQTHGLAVERDAVQGVDAAVDGDRASARGGGHAADIRNPAVQFTDHVVDDDIIRGVEGDGAALS